MPPTHKALLLGPARLPLLCLADDAADRLACPQLIITFGELRELDELRGLDVSAMLHRARAAKLVSYYTHADGCDVPYAALGGPKGDPASLSPRPQPGQLVWPDDDEAVISALHRHAIAIGGHNSQLWRRGSFVPYKAVAPIVDIDDGQLNYLLIEAIPPEQAVPPECAARPATLVRGYSKLECPSHADVLEQAVRPLADSGYRDIHCVGGGQIFHTAIVKTLLISGTATVFGTADHQITKMLLRKHFGIACARSALPPTPTRFLSCSPLLMPGARAHMQTPRCAHSGRLILDMPSSPPTCHLSTSTQMTSTSSRCVTCPSTPTRTPKRSPTHRSSVRPTLCQHDFGRR